MKTCDFCRSFVTFVTPGRTNNARIQVESRCTLQNALDGATEEYFLAASCKGEDTYGQGVLFLDPSYDFCGIFSSREFRIIRVSVPYQPSDTVGDVRDRFEAVHIQPRLVEAEELPTNEAIVAATLASRVLNRRIEFADGDARATIEFPIKTMNVNDLRGLYQVDTGPILLPDFTSRKPRAVERFELAFAAYNKPDEAYFVIQEPIPVGSSAGSPLVTHYSRIVRRQTRNSIIAFA